MKTKYFNKKTKYILKKLLTRNKRWYNEFINQMITIINIESLYK